MKKKLFLLLRLVVSFGLIGFIVYQISRRENISDLLTYYPTADYWILGGAAVLLLFLLAMGSLRWGILLSPQKINLSPLSIFMYYMIGMFFNQFLPSTVGGDVIKVYYLNKFTGKGAKSFVSIAMDRIVGMMGMCVVAIGSLLIGGDQLYRVVGPRYSLLIFSIVGAVSGGLLVFFLIIFNNKLMAVFLKLVRWEKLRQLVQKLHQAIIIYKGQKKIVAWALLVSIILWVVIVLICWLVYLAFHPPIGEISLKYFFLFIPAISVIMSLPISLGGLGTREAFFILFFTLVPPAGHIKMMDALVIAVNYYIISLVVSSLGGVIYILKDQLHFHREEIIELEEKEEGVEL